MSAACPSRTAGVFDRRRREDLGTTWRVFASSPGRFLYRLVSHSTGAGIFSTRAVSSDCPDSLPGAFGRAARWAYQLPGPG